MANAGARMVKDATLWTAVVCVQGLPGTVPGGKGAAITPWRIVLKGCGRQFAVRGVVTEGAAVGGAGDGGAIVAAGTGREAGRSAK
jgi:hypothetical protein